jgi:DNA helicase-2/ATP-dependent DNA helicase PcrA
MPSLPFTPRPKQQEVLDYKGGRMGVSAVPGSGKTHTLSLLAANIVAGGAVDDDQEVLIVTLVNSAVDNFTARLRDFIKHEGLMANLGYRVRTLHSLAHDIVRERPGLVGLSDNFQIVDEREADRIRQSAAETWLRSHPDVADEFLSPELEGGRADWARRERWPLLVREIALGYIRTAKDLQWSPAEVRDRLTWYLQPLPLAQMGWAIYTDYQQALAYRGAVDFDDLIRLALQALNLDADLLSRLRERWPYILEDEAQDSSRLQEEILGLLAGPGGNWVRVGDPNQAIYETFTTASPQHLRRFMDAEGVQGRELPNSGRSTPTIIGLANYLIDWTRSKHPEPRVRDALSLPHIVPTPPGDPQPNPLDETGQVHLVSRIFTPGQEVQAVADSLQRWLPEHPTDTVAVLVPRNDRGFAVASELKKRDLPHMEMLRSTRSTREAAGALGNILQYLSDPASTPKLSTVYRVWRRDLRDDANSAETVKAIAQVLRSCQHVEDYLWPRAGADWLADMETQDEYAPVCEELAQFRKVAQAWQKAALLPVDQLVLTLAQDLFHEPPDLALAHKLAGLLAHASESHPSWRLPELVEELAVIAKNERKFLGLTADDTGFNPDEHRGKVVIATIHKAKGLEWDRVYLMSVNNYDFPSASPHDRYISEKWFVRDHLNLEAEALAQLTALDVGQDGILSSAEGQKAGRDGILSYTEGQATEKARLGYASERVRLLYVGITRAKRDLIVTWNTGRDGDLQPAVPLIALQEYWEGQAHATAD